MLFFDSMHSIRQWLYNALLLCATLSAYGMNLLPSEDSADESLTLNGDSHTLELPSPQAIRLWELVVARNITIEIELKQQKNTDGTLFSFYGGRMGRELLLELESSSQKGEITVKFRTPSGSVKEYSTDINLNDGKWHKVIFAIQGRRLHLVIDCKERHNREDLDLQFSSESEVQVLIGQKTWRKQPFKGKLREFSADAGYSISEKCPMLLTPVSAGGGDTSGDGAWSAPPSSTVRPRHLPSASNHLHRSTDVHSAASSSVDASVQRDVEYLKHRVHHLENQFKHWRSVVQKYETQLKHVQLHQRGCQINGNVLLADGEKWRNETQCTECVCSANTAHCQPIGCPSLTCAHPLRRNNSCCPVCGERCYYNSQYYDHGHEFWPKSCVLCVCQDGNMDCQYKRENDCPPAPCPSHKQQTPPNECCPVCVDDDFCSRRPCHANATCVNEKFKRTCRCKQGFFGNGDDCFDVDECVWDAEARMQLGGCGEGTRCINTQGGFRCDCMPGFAKIDERHCLDLLRV